MALFLLAFYVIPVNYYFPTNNGVLGDNYFHLEKALSNSGYIKHHHPLFPLIPEKFISILQYFNILSIDSPSFLEQSFYWSILPVSLEISFAIGFFCFMVFNKGVMLLKLITIFLFLVTSYGAN